MRIEVRCRICGFAWPVTVPDLDCWQDDEGHCPRCGSEKLAASVVSQGAVR